MSTRRLPGSLQLIVMNPGDDTRAMLRALQPTHMEEKAAPFADAVVGYLGDTGERRSLLDDAVLSPMGGK
jgi:hypothetical protein